MARVSLRCPENRINVTFAMYFDANSFRAEAWCAYSERARLSRAKYWDRSLCCFVCIDEAKGRGNGEGVTSIIYTASTPGIRGDPRERASDMPVPPGHGRACQFRNAYYPPGISAIARKSDARETREERVSKFYETRRRRIGKYTREFIPLDRYISQTVIFLS